MGAVVRRPVAVVAAIVLYLEAVGIVVINGVLATFVGKQNMSLDGLDPEAMAMGTWVMGGVFGVFLAACGTVLLVAGIRDRAPGRFGRILLVSCAVVHGVLGALTVGLVGWHAFAFLMVVLGLVVLSLVAYGTPGAEKSAEKSEDGGPVVSDGAATA
ncbi:MULTISPECIES: hypothetical protein [unclassified Streptomyces]|uniref:hypothetical protein n=1 Tax=unclassified Streptomyces TaxID=2593676 RepID=UPI00224EA950|nr:MULTISPECIES: hypothetical protein [unclassified Streptomyces]MCX4512859.1 hypothetical protein [Streptomyces sp. NBC_01619]